MRNRAIWIGLTILALAALGATAGTTLNKTGDVPLDEQVTALAGLHGGQYTAARNALITDGDATLPGLRALLDHDDELVASAALACAGWIEHGEHYDAFLAEPTPRTAAGTLRFIGPSMSSDTTLTPLMVEMVLFSGDEELRRVAAVDLLERLRDPRALPALYHALQHDPSPVVRMTVANAMQREPDAAATDELVDALSAEADADVRAEIVMALGWRKDAAAVPVLLETVASETQADCRGAAVQALGWIRDDSATPALVGVLSGDADAGVRGKAALALSKIGGAEARTALQQAAVSDADPEVVRLAGVALKRIE